MVDLQKTAKAVSQVKGAESCKCVYVCVCVCVCVIQLSAY